ncbi:cytochrome c [Rhizobium sp. CF142]|uniref:cytochrome c n=1 Tax=Rhizobium sp. CF142 TaxID=1144314 RepID=UPI00026EF4D6|nr:cytochrome c [Rhizobium sp. CF142]EJJ27076.1 cytochrome c553 [Rhizobium sp. CF142]
MKKIPAFLAIAVIVVAAWLYWFATRIPSSPFDGAAIERPPITLQQGEYAARLGDCVACHSIKDGPAFAGGLEMGTPLGSIFSTNITPDKQTGIGNYTLADFDNAVRRGVAPDGRRLYPAMPYPSYEKLSDGDVLALYNYFMNHVEPVHQANRPSRIPPPLNMRWPLAFWNSLFTDGAYRSDRTKDASWNRGAYLVQGPGHCGACHTPRGLAMQEVSLDGGKPQFLSGTNLDGWYVPSLRNDHNTGLGRWSEQDIVAYLKDGRNQHGVVFGPMAEVVNNSTAFVSDEDLSAIAHYLKSFEGDPERDGKPWVYKPGLLQSSSTTGAMSVLPGAQAYAARCGFCHGPDGKGRSPWMPPLAGTSAVLSKDPASMINITLNGSLRVVSGGTPDLYRMPSFREQLSDQQIADLMTYIRSSWGNEAPPVAAQAVGAMREHSDAATSEVIILQMR